MDYDGDYTTKMIGLISWDYAATRMFYGEVATMFADDDLKADTTLSIALLTSLMDYFGGILGLRYKTALSDFPDNSAIHYSELNTHYRLIDDCQQIDPTLLQPSDYDAEKYGTFSPLMDGLTVKVDGQYSRCKQRRVAYVRWDDLSMADYSGYYRGGGTVDPWGRTRVPYCYASDRWADLGNAAVYRHDIGADPYELFNFFVTEQELKHIFDNYRRDRQSFSVRSASDRILTRYNEKMRDAAKGLGLIKNKYREKGAQIGLQPDSYFAAIVEYWGAQDSMLAAGMAFDHYARQIQRPNAGEHYDPSDTVASPYIVLRWTDYKDPVVVVPDGAQGYWNNVGIGGKPVNNSYDKTQGEYYTKYIKNAGSYYDKLHTAMLLTESVDNYVSDDLEDFVDARHRSVSIADLFPDGYRRWIGNNLTGDDWIKGPRVAANNFGHPLTQDDGYPAQPIGWTSWWPDTPELCFPNEGTTVCSAYSFEGNPFEPTVPSETRVLDPQIGWEQHKFLIAWTLVYLPENQKQTWLDMMGIWSVGDDTDPNFDNRIELHMPSGDVYVARTYGTEDICFEFCQTVQRGIGARILGYANKLLAQAYVTTEVTHNGVTWYEPVIGDDGKPIVRFDPELRWINPEFYYVDPPADCHADPNPNDDDWSAYAGCECHHNASCIALENYISVPDFMRQAMRDFGMADPSMQGVY